jgi:type I restriction enzyme M protein
MSSSKGPDDRQIVEILEQLCVRLKLTQAQLAEKLNVSLPTMNRWMNSRSFPRGKQRREFLAVLDQLKESQPEVFDQVQERQAGLTLKRSGPGRGMLSTKSMEQMLWDAACSIRGEKDAPKFKDYILPLIFIKRLSDVFEDEVKRLVETYGDEDTALSILEADHTLVRFYLPPEARWPVVNGRQPFEWPAKLKPKTLGEQLTTSVRLIVKANPDRKMEGVIDIVDFNETRNGEREISDQALAGVVETLSDPRYRLGLQDVEPDFLGRAYEYLLRKFAEGQGQSAGEFFTPQEVGWLMAYLVRPRQGEDVYDYACGSAGLLIKCELALIQRELKVTRPLKLYGQELTGSSYAIARMNMVIHDMEGEIVRGNSMSNPKFRESDTSLKKFDIVVANPMWNQPFDEKVLENDPLGRFEEAGGLTSGKGDWAWLQHTIASLKPTGRAAVVLDTGAASRGSGKKNDDKERNIRKWFVEHDLVEGVILLPDNLFYNTNAPGIIIVLNKNKPKARVGKIVLVNAGLEFKKGQPKNYLTQESIRKIADAFVAGVDVDKFVKVITNADSARNDFNLAPSRYVAGKADEEYREMPEILEELKTLSAKSQTLDHELTKLMRKLGV